MLLILFLWFLNGVLPLILHFVDFECGLGLILDRWEGELGLRVQ